MGESAGLPAINEIAHFLNEFAPSTAAELAGRGSEYAGLLAPGVIGGEDGEEIPDSVKSRGMRIRSEILSVALREAVAKADERSTQIQSKLATLRLLRFVAGVCSAIGAMGTAGSALVGKQTWTVALSLVTLASNVANAASTMLVLGAGKKEADLIEFLRTLARSRSYSSLAAANLAAAANGGIPSSDLVAMLKDANVQYRDLNDALARSIF
jgi:hypothetical protein